MNLWAHDVFMWVYNDDWFSESPSFVVVDSMNWSVIPVFLFMPSPVLCIHNRLWWFSVWCAVRWLSLCVLLSLSSSHALRICTRANSQGFSAHLLGYELIQSKQLRFENDRPDFSMGLLSEGSERRNVAYWMNDADSRARSYSQSSSLVSKRFFIVNVLVKRLLDFLFTFCLFYINNITPSGWRPMLLQLLGNGVEIKFHQCVTVVWACRVGSEHV